MAPGLSGIILWVCVVGLLASYMQQIHAKRYRSCAEGCCIHEYCAYHRICYPKIHCRFGCPDGACIDHNGTDPNIHHYSIVDTETSATNTNKLYPNDLDMFSGDAIDQRVSRSHSASEQQHKSQYPTIHTFAQFLGLEKAPSRKASPNPIHKQPDVIPQGHRNIKSQSGSLEAASEAKDIAQSLPGNGGICMPKPPCKSGDYCGMGHSCSYNYNLGYHTCQYNLEMGSTLCYDSKGELNVQHPT